MSLTDVSLIGTLKTRMAWLQERQQVLSQNVANADTPGFKARDLSPFDPSPRLAQPAVQRAALLVTDPAHIAGAAGGDNGRFGRPRTSAFEVRPSGNAVVLEDEMMKVAQNQMDYQAATSLYSRSLGLIKLALGKGR